MSKYKTGNKIGPHNVLFIERYGKTRRGLFQCVNCSNTFEADIYNVAKGDRRFCDVCSKNYASRFGVREANNEKRKRLSAKAIEKIKPGQKYGHLTVIKKTDKTKNTKRIWLCECDCENRTKVEVRSDLLLNGHTQSCGCIGSIGEQTIGKILIQLGYNFQTQKTFDGCRNPETNHLLYFDFYLSDYNCCIEYDGEQHFRDTSGWFSKMNFAELQMRDKIKNNYCKDNNIVLIRIPYVDLKKLNIQYLEELINESCTNN